MGFAKYYEDNYDAWTEREYSGKYYTPETKKQETIKPSTETTKTYSRNKWPQLINTSAFIVCGNRVRISTENKKVFWALKASLKEHGANFDYQSKSWTLSDEQLCRWLTLQSGYGWLRRIVA